MSPDLEQEKQSLEEITLKAKEIKDSLLPVERRIRETSIIVPKTIILGKLYDELLMIQRIAMLKNSKDEDNTLLIRMQGRTIFAFTTALNMPLRDKDFPFNYDDFYRGSLGSSSRYSSSEEFSSLDFLVQAQNSDHPKEKTKIPSYYVLENRTELEGVKPQTLKDLQYFHSLEGNKFVEAYVNLLREIKNKLGIFAEFNQNELPERDIPINVPNIPIKIVLEQLPRAYQKEEKRIMEDMINSDDWTKSLETIQNFINDFRNPRKGNMRRYRVLSTDSYLTPVTLAPAPDRESIIGIDDNLKRLEALVRGYAKGKSTPNIVLIGPGGVGKTTSLRYVMEATADAKNVRYFLMSSLNDIKQLAELSGEYKPIGVIDDMRGEVNPNVYDQLKQQLEGLGNTFFDRALIIISANPEVWNKLDDPVKQRLGGVELKYEPNPQSYDLLIKEFCDQFGVEYKPEIVEQVKEMVPRQVRDYIRALGSEQAGQSSQVGN